MADYKKELEEMFKRVYERHDFLNKSYPNYEAFVWAMFADTGESYESISNAIQEGIDRGETLQENLDFAEKHLSKKR